MGWPVTGLLTRNKGHHENADSVSDTESFFSQLVKKKSRKMSVEKQNPS